MLCDFAIPGPAAPLADHKLRPCSEFLLSLKVWGGPSFPMGANLETKKTLQRIKTYTTSTERQSFGELFWPQRQTFQVGGGYKNPMKPKKAISATEIFPLWPPFFSAKKVLHWSRAVYAFFFPVLLENFQSRLKTSISLKSK